VPLRFGGGLRRRGGDDADRSGRIVVQPGSLRRGRRGGLAVGLNDSKGHAQTLRDCYVGLLQIPSAAIGSMTRIISAWCCGQTWWIAVISTSAASSSSRPRLSRLFSPAITPFLVGSPLMAPHNCAAEDSIADMGVAGLAGAATDPVRTPLM